MVRYLVYRFLYVSIDLMMKLRWWRWRVEGLENLPPRSIGGMIIAVNHVHWLDILAVGRLLPFSYRVAWLGKSELFRNPVQRWLLQNMHVIPVDRGKRDMAALQAAEEGLRRGEVLLIFPEGTRSKTGMLQKGRSGAVRLAMRTGVPIIPAALIGTHHGIGGTLRGQEVVLRIGTPYYIKARPDTGNHRAEYVSSATTDLMMQIAAMLPEGFRGHYRTALPQARLGP
ncbi:MAG: 1-acyl-sn-glycerol-3-phosphate acyltransferase [Chloroflexaceae bacterium]|nr:1-acyl-sn-glycerol-3-phosphate acyltransferase [Chloroflexaceae bacterium]